MRGVIGVRWGSRTVSAKREKTLRRARAAAARQQFNRQTAGAAVPAIPPPVATATVRAEPAAQGNRWTTFLEGAQRHILAATYWFDAPSGMERSPVRVRFSGRRTGTGAHAEAGDHFVCEETVPDVEDRGGRISVTTRVRNIAAGDWLTAAAVVVPDLPRRDQRGARPAADAHVELHQAGWSWRSWSLRDRPDTPVATCLVPAIKVPGLLPFIWGPMVLVGVLLGLLLQSVVVAHLRLSVGRTLAVSVVALIAGAVGAQLWYAVIKRGQHDINGWCIQGFLVAFTLVAPAMATALGVAVGTFLDVSAPGVFLGAVVGRFGCFLAGCCSGRPTTSRWGIWSSNQSVGGVVSRRSSLRQPWRLRCRSPRCSPSSASGHAEAPCSWPASLPTHWFGRASSGSVRSDGFPSLSARW